jgi:hypothetical protein
MPLFMDVHSIEGGVSEADVAGAHQADLAEQGSHGVNYLRYWVDEEAGKIGDPCWEGASARALAMLAEIAGDVDPAFAQIADARIRCNRLSDPYVWPDGYILDAQCQLGVRHGHPDTAMWVGALRNLASRTGMRGLALRSLEHGAALGDDGAAAAADAASSRYRGRRLISRPDSPSARAPGPSRG